MQTEQDSAAGPQGEGGRLQEAARPQVSASVLRGGHKERRNWEEFGSERSLAGKSGGRGEEKKRKMRKKERDDSDMILYVFV